MPAHACYRGIDTVNLFLEGVPVAAICIGWKVEDMELGRVQYLLACIAAATFISKMRPIATFDGSHQS